MLSDGRFRIGFEWFPDMFGNPQNGRASNLWIVALSYLRIAHCRNAGWPSVANGSLLVALMVSLLLHVMGLLAGFHTSAGVFAGQVGRAVLSVRLVDASGRAGNADSGVVVERHEALPSNRKQNVMQETVVPKEELSRSVAEQSGQSVVPAMEDPVSEAWPLFLPVDAISIRPYPLTLLEGIGPPEVDPGEMYGRSVLKVWVDDVGVVVDVEVLFSDMPESLIKAGVSAFKRMRFMPGYLDGRPMGSVMTVEIAAQDFLLPVQ